MIFLLNKKEQEEVNKLIETKYYNDEVAVKLNKEVIKNQAYIDMIKEYNIESLSINKYKNNSFYQNVKIVEKNFNGYQLKYDRYLANECFLSDEIEVDEDDYFLIKNKIAYFPNEFKFLSLSKNNRTWMSIIPHEINTMEKDLINCTKNVYVFGLGLGYYPYMLKESNHITVVEKEKEIIDLFNKYIFPYFDRKERYEIINSDAFDFVKKLNKQDLIYIDLWHDNKDGFETYYKFKHLLKGYNVRYWIEESLIALFRNLLITLIEEELYHQGEVDYSEEENFNDVVINKLHHRFLNKKINKYQEIKELLRSSSLKSLISEL